MRTKLKDNEKVLFKTKPHWYFLITSFLLATLIIAVSIILYFNINYPFFVLFVIIIFSTAFMYYKYYERMVDIWVVTSLRLIDESGVFTVKVKESPLDKINNVSYQQSLLGRLLGFGNVEIQTAAEMGATIYNGLESPRELSDALTSAQENYKQNIVLGQGVPNSQPAGLDAAGDTMECPFCAETIKIKAKICRFCGKELKTGTF